MSHVVNHADPLQQLRTLYLPIQHELAACEERLQLELQSQYPYVDQLVKHGFRIGGKRLRPALLLLAAKCVGDISNDHIVLAAVMEMIHTATLVHDDVLDEAGMRRHLDTVNSIWGNETSILLGDFLFSHAFFLSSTLDDTYACRQIGRSTTVVCSGELRQIESRGRFDLSEDVYLAIINAKTAELCACCCQLGVRFAGGSEKDTKNLEAFGRDLGISFQISDDILDLVGQEETAGKSLGTDLEKQKLTLPLIHLLRESGEKERAEIISRLNTPEAKSPTELIQWLHNANSLKYSQEKAKEYAEQACDRLTQLPRSEARLTLEQMTEFVINRQH